MASRAEVQSLLLFIFLVLGYICGISDAGKGRIVGGHTTDISDAPYVVRVIHNSFSCGGTLINSTYVLTAAHCVHNYKPEEFEVLGGSRHRDGDPNAVRCRVNAIITPKSYGIPWSDMDAAVLRLSKPMTGRNIKPIKLCSKRVPVGHRVKAYGWGLTQYNGGYSNWLRSIEMTVVSKADCQSGFSAEITDNMLCAGEPGYPDYDHTYDRDPKSACVGDSGGPLVYNNNELCGIISFAKGCASWPYANVYTSVYEIRGFIEFAMNSDFKTSCRTT